MAQQFLSKWSLDDKLYDLPKKEDCLYTQYFCEENIYMLVKKIKEKTPEKLPYCFPVFISNERTCIPLWRQSTSKEEDGFVAWDYHVIMVYCGNEECFVYDFDTQLPFPTHFSRYCEETFKSDEILQPQYHRFFRVISAELYLKYFSSDRCHMKNEDGTWRKPPPSYPIIQSSGQDHNLSQYISMKEDEECCGKYGHILNLSGFIHRFSVKNNSKVDYMYPPDPLQPSWLE